MQGAAHTKPCGQKQSHPRIAALPLTGPTTDSRKAYFMTMSHHQHLCLGVKGFHKMAFVAWAEPSTPEGAVPTLCVHGLTRNGRDFDSLAEHLATRGPVIAPDIVGRGASDWLPDPTLYAFPTYLADVASLIARLGAPEINYVGTSMGGLIGMLLAAQPGSPIRRLVLNDIGPLVPKASLARIATYVGTAERFETLEALEAHLRRIHAPFGPLTDAQWHHLAVHGHRQLEDGSFVLSYDPAIGVPMQAPPEDVVLWPFYDRITCPTLVIRGESSDLLLPETVQEMTTRGPKATLYEVTGCGHAPALMAEDQISRVVDFLGE